MLAGKKGAVWLDPPPLVGSPPLKKKKPLTATVLFWKSVPKNFTTSKKGINTRHGRCECC